MHLRDILAKSPTTFSFEFFPAKTEEAGRQLLERARELAELDPAYVSVTYGAGGSTRDRTRKLVVELKDTLGLNVMAHLTCVGSSKDELREILEQYQQQGVENILALRGDPPANVPDFQIHPDGLGYANELVELIKQVGDFGVAVAGYPEGHPETISKLDDMDHLKRKVDAGADLIVTQLFFDNRDFYDFRERCQVMGINVPIIAGIMPIVSWSGIQRMAGMCGARIPSKLLKRLYRAGDDAQAVEKIGIDWATWQCHDLLDHDVRGIHLYTLNRSGATAEIYRRLGATCSGDLVD